MPVNLTELCRCYHKIFAVRCLTAIGWGHGETWECGRSCFVFGGLNMRRLQCGALATVAVIGFVSTASAADMPTKALVYKTPVAASVYSWTGWYVGGNVGYGWGTADPSSSFTCPAGAFGPCPISAPLNTAAISAAGTGSLSPRGFTGGVQAGYNWQTGNVVLGGEADFNSFRLSASRTVAAPFPTAPASAFTATTGVDTNWLSTIRARLGWVAAPNLLVYGTGGLALTSFKVSNAFSDNAVFSAGTSSSSSTKAGWALGGGLEWALDRNWTVKGEYLHVDFGTVTTAASVNNPALFVGVVADNFATSSKLRADIARLGLNYKFGL